MHCSYLEGETQEEQVAHSPRGDAAGPKAVAEGQVELGLPDSGSQARGWSCGTGAAEDMLARTVLSIAR